MGTDSPRIPLTLADALPRLRSGQLSRADDLTRTRPAQHLVARRRAYRKEHAAALLRGRLRGDYDPEHRALSREIAGARSAATELWELAAQRPVWRVLHSVQAQPSNGSRQRGTIELDQLVIGPGGVFAIDTVYRPVQPVSADTARIAARRSQETLRAATRVPVTVAPLLVHVRTAELLIDGAADDVGVLGVDDLVPWLCARRPVLTDRELEIVYLAARDRRTWAD